MRLQTVLGINEFHAVSIDPTLSKSVTKKSSDLTILDQRLNHPIIISPLVHITMTSHEHYVVSNHRSFDCLFKSLSVLTSNSALLALCEGNSPVTGECPAQKTSNAEKNYHAMTPLWSVEKITGNVLWQTHYRCDVITLHEAPDLSIDGFLACISSVMHRRKSNKHTKGPTEGMH